MSRMSKEKLIETIGGGLLNTLDEFIYSVYMMGVADGKSESEDYYISGAYEQGLNEAWQCARDIMINDRFNDDEIMEIFGDSTLPENVLEEYTAQEALKKIANYISNKEFNEVAKKVEIGDEYIYKRNGKKFVITKIFEYDGNNHNEGYYVLWEDGSAGTRYELEDDIRTGMNFGNVNLLLDAIKK